jgi:hypothetical protein
MSIPKQNHSLPSRKTTDSISAKPLKKKIGFFSSIMLVIGSSIGAGIFIKN